MIDNSGGFGRLLMPQRYGFEPGSPAPSGCDAMTERAAVVLLAEWFERDYAEVVTALRGRMGRTGETVDEATMTGLVVGGTWVEWSRG